MGAVVIDLRLAAEAIGASLEGPATRAAGVSTDSRRLSRGDLFVALAGEHHDGHAFDAQAYSAGAAAAMVGRDRPIELPRGAAVMRVDDPLASLGALAAWWRRRFALPLIAITGSNGKTTVKEMVASVLRAATGSDSAFLATRGNLNNQIGLPLTLLRLSSGHRFAVVEMGMNHPGELAQLAGMAQPTVAVINNAAAAHLEGLGSIEAVARAKGEIFGGLASGGTAVINADDPFAGYWRSRVADREVIDFGLDTGAAVTGSWSDDPEGGDAAGIVLDIDLRGRRVRTRLRVRGEHNARNALAAAACALAAGVEANAIGAGLAEFRGVGGRQQRKPGMAGASLIDDSYNANPSSVRAAIDVLSSLPGRRVLALADMRELGPDGLRLHSEVGEYARASGVDQLYATGELARATIASFGAGGQHFDSAEALAAALLPTLTADTTVLIKGSRSMRMERVVAALQAPGSESTEEAH